ncbi:MAG: hypothetical protein C0454_02175 [Parvibaculum sp.]|jgi:hypothetical protein|nr:hypothetical protein [Parvibaculum sp.]
MNENSTLRYLGEAYRGVNSNLESVWTVLGSDVAMQFYAVGAAVIFAIYSTGIVVRSMRDFAGAMRSALRRV